MVCAILAISGPQSLDASDALALGLCHGQTRASLLLQGAAGS
jgi:Holliday junction resolvasome RuvABC endonuclease subunit